LELGFLFSFGFFIGYTIVCTLLTRCHFPLAQMLSALDAQIKLLYFYAPTKSLLVTETQKPGQNYLHKSTSVKAKLCLHF